MIRVVIIVVVLVCVLSAIGFGVTSWLSDRTVPPEQALDLSADAGEQPAGAPEPQPAQEASQPEQSSSSCPIYLVDVIDETGIEYVNFSGMSPEKLYPAANNTGVAMIDYDQDGHLDLYFGNGELLLPGGEDHPTEFWRSLGNGKFINVTIPSGTEIYGFTFGLGVGDYDNDGFPDLYVARYRDNIMLRNNGDGTFSDVTAESGTGDDHWANSVAFFDYDYDGVLDLYVTNYGLWNLEWHKNHICGEGKPFVRLFCTPKIVPVAPNVFYRGLGDGRFVDVNEQLGLKRPDSRSTSVIAVDLNLDNLIDIYVTNDLEPNFTFINVGGGKFEDWTEDSFAGYDARGVAQASMGIDAADVDGDGLPEMHMCHFFMDHNTIYKNLGDGIFRDDSYWTGIGRDSVRRLCWASGMEDFDNDGWVDIVAPCGHVDDNMHELGRDEPYAQLPLLWRNIGGGKFQLLGSEAGPYLAEPKVSRGAAFGDLDNDGDVDFVVLQLDEPPSIVRNDSPADNDWIQIKLTGTISNRDAVGTRVEVDAAGRRFYRQVMGGRSYAAAHDLRLTIGLGKAESVETVTIFWPSGRKTVVHDLPVRRTYWFREPIEPDREEPIMLPVD